jgi:hypothetical protein
LIPGKVLHVSVSYNSVRMLTAGFPHSLLCSGLIDHAIVFAKDDNEYRILGSSPGYLVRRAQKKTFAHLYRLEKLRLPQVPREELQEVRKIFADAGTGPHIQKARETGFRIAGTNYLSVKGDARSLYGKQASHRKTRLIALFANDVSKRAMKAC